MAVHTLRRLTTDRRVRYVLVGSVSAVIYYATFTAGWLALTGQVSYLVVALAANVFTATVTYPLYRRGVFGSQHRWWRSLLRFYLVCLWALAFTLGGLALLVETAGLPVLLAQAVVIVLGPLVNYQLGRLWAFRDPTDG